MVLRGLSESFTVNFRDHRIGRKKGLLKGVIILALFNGQLSEYLEGLPGEMGLQNGRILLSGGIDSALQSSQMKSGRFLCRGH